MRRFLFATACALAAGSALAGDLPDMVRIPAGSFQMGSQPGEPGREGDEAPRRVVTLANPFWVSRHEVTQAQWSACALDKACGPVREPLGDDYPVTGISWKDAQAYLTWLSGKTGKRYRFLTESEWEYAARAGSQTPYPSGQAIVPADANYAASGFGKPVPVGRYAPNRFGLHDMVGNAWEWVADCYEEMGYNGAPVDGRAVERADCHMRVLRGGAFDTRPEQLRVAYRYKAQFSGQGVGLRVAMDDQPAQKAFMPGALWPDDKGVHINAHGGGLLKHDGVTYWFGEHKVAGSAGNRAQVGVHVYSSRNLVDWRDEGIALAVSDDPLSDIVRDSIIERPKVIRNPRTGQFVMWFHLELKGLGYKAARAAVAVADKVTGPYRYVGSFRPNAGAWPVNVRDEDKRPGSVLARDFETGQMARDSTLFVDTDGQAYHLYASEENHTLHISRLSEDFQKPAGQYARMKVNGDDEAPAIFKRKGRYYLITSGLTGWAPNPAKSYVADHIFGPWKELGNPVRGTPEQMATTFGGQSTFALTLNRNGCERQILMLDIWRPKDAIDGRYAWLPIEWEEGKPVVRWRDHWTLEDLDRLPCEPS
ncbi:SUMF1/EgtB/PvdO family nonheme iron enzyme [Roseateles sp.]|uniref:SUMF1/EgtB/PvdO family nonheme iron enzyme n=1 Tax=Roseateles sp. TaxID=1971397 RepID=UPI0039EAA87B